MEGFFLINICGLKLAFGEQAVFNKIDWQIMPKSKIGLVGANGAGKTTLLRVLAGVAEPDGGSVSLPTGSAVGFLPQDLVEIDDMPLLDYLRRQAGLERLSCELTAAERRMAELTPGSAELKWQLSAHERLQRQFDAKGGFGFEVEARQVLKGLGFYPEKDENRRTTEFSGGWKMRVALAALLLARPDVLLLDEPTNHLDTESMEWLENWLQSYSGTMLAVSHDRRFLKKIVTSVAELARGKIYIYKCSYEKYLMEREERRARLEAEHEQQKEKIGEIQRFVERFRYKATKAAQVQSRLKQLEKMEVTVIEGPSRSVSFKFPESPRGGLDVLTAKNLTKRYDDNEVFANVNLTIQRGERVALVGVNGAGKSTLLRLLNKTEEPSGGSVAFGLNVKRAYFSQESAQNLDYSRTIWQEVNSVGSKLLDGAKRNLLGAFLFSGSYVNKPISVLSGGEKSRVGLLKMLLSESNLLILDEPTNHLDFETRELFQRALLQYSGTVLIVSHDRAFLDDLVERIIEIRDGEIFDYKGNYSWFIEKRDERPLNQNSPKNDGEPRTESPERTKEDKRAAAKERNRIYREKKIVLDKLKPIETVIENAETRKAAISELLCDPEILADSRRVQVLMIELKSVGDNLAELYPQWETLSAQIEEIG